MKRFFTWLSLVLVVAIFAAAVAAFVFKTALGPPAENYQARAVYAPNHVIATSQPLASQAGLMVLENGGNAVDAAVTAAAVLSVVEPYMTGIGGDMFAIHWSAKEQKLTGLSGSGYAGALMTREAIGDRGKVPDEGAKSITLPGALAGWATLLETHGTISLAEALAPAIVLAEKGFPVSEVTATEWALFTSKLFNDSGARETFLIGGERTPKAGEWYKNPDYANTLKQISEKGVSHFYQGELGEKIATHVQSLGGFLTDEDFKRYRAEWVTPISVNYKNYKIWELPPNGQGIAALEMLRILEPFDLQKMQHNSAEYLHHLIEAKKLAYADLEYFVGDPEFMSITPEQILSDEFINKRRANIDSNHAMERANPEKSLTTSETTYLTVADKDGNMVSFINSLAGSFGSGVVVPGTGFALQNRGVGLSMKPDRANSVEPGRRPFHTIIPGFVTKVGADGNESAWLSFGIVGGAQQPQAHVQVLLNMILFDMDPQQALDAPRFRHWEDNNVSFENSIPESVVEELRAMGHKPQNPLMSTAQHIFLGNNRGLLFGGGQAILKQGKGYVAGSDSRRDGAAAGY